MIPCPALAALLFTAIALAQPINPGKDWERAKPEDEGYSSKRLGALKGYLAMIDTTAMMAVHKGKVVFEYGDVTRQGMLASVRKSILAILYGKYVANGKINLEATLEALGIDDVGGLLPVEKRAKVRDLITSRSGVFHKNSNPGGGDDASFHAPPRGTQQPGSYFIYNNWDFNVAGHVFERQTGLDIFDALQNDLAKPIGMQDFDRALQKKSADDPTLSKFPAYRVTLTTRDMARIGQLMLQNGKWEGKQVVPADWIKSVTSLVTPVDDLNPASERYQYGFGLLWGYGSLWWVWDDHRQIGPFQGAYSAMGTGGQYITVLPAYDLVVAHMAPLASPGQPSRGVTLLQYHAILLQLVTARCGRACQ